ncbi:DUF1501 domain-containing protein [Pendulispora rubella]|uniref:DUF1501 domain-containing protein n=1 Tax=Pendulispora rubella TaxID=2741070 RepID=A0ABZ2LHT5_9BACT
MDHGTDRRTMLRRTLLKGAIVGAGIACIPGFGAGREARAALPSGAPARRVLILNFTLGIRSSAAFYASSKKRYNPYGLIQGDLPFPVGAFLDDCIPSFGEAPVPDSAYLLPGAWNGLSVLRMRDFARAEGFSVVGSWDPGRGDHTRDESVCATGSAEPSGIGILSRIYAGLAGASSPTDAPGFHLHPRVPFGRAPHFLSEHTPIAVSGAKALPGSRPSPVDQNDVRARTGHDWSRDATWRTRFDRGIAARRSGSNGAAAATMEHLRASGATVGPALANWVNVANPNKHSEARGTVDISPDRSGHMVPLTNQMLFDAFTRAVDDPNQQSLIDAAVDLGMAVRLLQLGSRAVTVEIDGFDSHFQEFRTCRALYRAVGRFWPTIHFVLSRVADPLLPGKSLLDTTLVCTTSDFGRDPGSDETGFSAGEGTDHGNDPSCYYLAHACMGAGLRGGRVLSAPSTDDYRADKIAERYAPDQFLAMVLSAMGLDAANPNYGFPAVSDPIRRLFG